MENRKKRIKRRRNSQFHMGGDVMNRHPGIEMYVHSTQDGKVRRDMNKTIDQMGIVLNRVEERLEKKESVMLVGTSSEVGRMMERIYEDVDENKRVRVSRTWVSGMRTNYTNFKNYVTRFKATHDDRKTHAEKRWYELNRKGREGIVGLKMENGEETDGKGRPALIVFRNPNDHVVGRKEALRCGIPTVGLVDGDCKYSERLTYPIPGNDDSRVSQITFMRRLKGMFVKKMDENVDSDENEVKEEVK